MTFISSLSWFFSPWLVVPLTGMCAIWDTFQTVRRLRLLYYNKLLPQFPLHNVICLSCSVHCSFWRLHFCFAIDALWCDIKCRTPSFKITESSLNWALTLQRRRERTHVWWSLCWERFSIRWLWFPCPAERDRRGEKKKRGVKNQNSPHNKTQWDRRATFCSLGPFEKHNLYSHLRLSPEK